MTITIYHNTACGTSRNTLQLIRDAGFEPVIIDYVKQPPSRDELVDLIARAGLSVRAAMRNKGALYDELGLADAALSDASAAGRHAGSSDPDQSPHRDDRAGRAPVPAS